MTALTTNGRMLAIRRCLSKMRNSTVLGVLRFGRNAEIAPEVRMHERVIAAQTGLSRLQVKWALYDLSQVGLVARSAGHAWALNPETRS